MNNSNVLMGIGLGINSIMILIDKLFYSVPNYIYIPVLIIGIVTMLMGFFKAKRS